MGRIASYDVWQVYDHETLNDDDLLSFAKSLFEEGFIKVSTVYDKNTDTIKTRYDMTAIKEEILDLEEVAIYIINTMLKLYSSQIKERYNKLKDTAFSAIMQRKVGFWLKKLYISQISSTFAD